VCSILTAAVFILAGSNRFFEREEKTISSGFRESLAFH